jgi:hypothetical protein
MRTSMNLTEKNSNSPGNSQLVSTGVGSLNTPAAGSHNSSPVQASTALESGETFAVVVVTPTAVPAAAAPAASSATPPAAAAPVAAAEQQSAPYLQRPERNSVGLPRVLVAPSPSKDNLKAEVEQQPSRRSANFPTPPRSLEAALSHPPARPDAKEAAPKEVSLPPFAQKILTALTRISCRA